MSRRAGDGRRMGYARVNEIGEDERPDQKEVEKLVHLVVHLAKSCPQRWQKHDSQDNEWYDGVAQQLIVEADVA